MFLKKNLYFLVNQNLKQQSMQQLKTMVCNAAGLSSHNTKIATSARLIDLLNNAGNSEIKSDPPPPKVKAAAPPVQSPVHPPTSSLSSIPVWPASQQGINQKELKKVISKRRLNEELSSKHNIAESVKKWR